MRWGGAHLGVSPSTFPGDEDEDEGIEPTKVGDDPSSAIQVDMYVQVGHQLSDPLLNMFAR